MIYKKYVLFLLTSLALLSLGACNTVEGAGEDIEEAGDRIEEETSR